MSMREREGLVARIRTMRRVAAATDRPPPTARTEPDPMGFDALEGRIAGLERVLEGLQDSVHRESERHSKRLAELDARTQPAALNMALSRDARERGL
jgi:hypothetical protein